MLLRHMTLEGPVLEPSAGRGAIVRELRRHGLQVRASDLHDHGAEPDLGIETGVDFLSMTSMSGCRSIVMNPPFKELPNSMFAMRSGCCLTMARWRFCCARSGSTRSDVPISWSIVIRTLSPGV